MGEQGVAPVGGTALETILAGWRTPDQPLLALDAALRHEGVALEPPALAEVAWALLGVQGRARLQLGEARWTRLTHLAELHDVTLPSQARTLARQLAGEAFLVPDLLRARPWLREPGREGAENVLAAILHTEWSGFLALLGEFGPWVYVPTVADLQALSRPYARLVHQAAESQDAELLSAALQIDPPEESLLVRLEVTDYRQSGRREALSLRVGRNAAQLAELEQSFWDDAERLAQRRRAEWAARRGGPSA
ncbi:hypothetical protein DAERI_210034 [Deinococcus aerius]|uniref:Uncharacterized protein n=1 Tax=Deinococcus aerius TaxID=200253 RepID=A0A2I9DN67_9DEIO|nr:hypothetical protein DAERI_210034 [Deinococcus aerius]